MNIKLLRYNHWESSTGGLLFLDGVFECYTCEDEYRDTKVIGQTRIPAGRYQIKLRDEGGMNGRYHEKYTWHRGMLHLQDVPGFEWIYIHTGNDHTHTEGCILVGNQPNSASDYEAKVFGSADAYKALYLQIIIAIDGGQEVFIEIEDYIP